MSVYRVLCLGSNGKGQLGLGHEDDMMLPQQSFESKVPPKKIACGGNHTMLLLADGTLYWCGDNAQGQCSGTVKHSSTWVQVPGTFKDVACGWEYTVVIDALGYVRSIGRGNKGELGIKALVHSTSWNTLFRCVEPNPRCYSSFQDCIVQDGNTLYGWGNNSRHQLLDDDVRVIDTPAVIHRGRAIEFLSMGKDFVFFLDNGTTVMLTGAMHHMMPYIQSQYEPSHDPLRAAHCMWSSLHLLTAKNRLITAGRGSHGQLLAEPLPKNTHYITTGSEHGILSTTDNEVYCWGWGEHGNCGPTNLSSDPINDKSNVVSPLNRIGRFTAVSGIFGGCATTWIITKEC